MGLALAVYDIIWLVVMSYILF